MGIYVRKIKKGNHTYQYLVTSFRDGGKVRQKKLKYLGVNPAEEDIQAAKNEARYLLQGKIARGPKKEQL